jgi:hypothetical protein
MDEVDCKKVDDKKVDYKKVDYKRELRTLYGGRVGQFTVVQVPSMNFLMIDGHGDPNTSDEYADAVRALYPLAYTIKFMCKKNQLEDFAVMPLEGVWWAEDMRDFTTGDKSNWLWTLMIMQPPVVTSELFERAVEQVAAKQNPGLLSRVRLDRYDEGRAAQVLYTGAFSDEGPTIERLHAFIAEQGGRIDETTKHHHEIYLSDPRRTEPSKLKTIIRQPF